MGAQFRRISEQVRLDRGSGAALAGILCPGNGWAARASVREPNPLAPSLQVRQKLNLGGNDFIPTANERNFLMLKEASEFAAHLRRCEQDIATLKESVEGACEGLWGRAAGASKETAAVGQKGRTSARASLSGVGTVLLLASHTWGRPPTTDTGILNTGKIVLSAPLPRVYEDAGNGKAQPQVQNNAPPGLIGGNFDAEELSRVSKDTVRPPLYPHAAHAN